MTTNEKIRDFRINLSSDSFENVKKIKENIDKIAEKSEIQELCSDLSNIIEVPEDVLSKKFKQVIYDKFDFYDISPQFKLKYSILSSLKYFIFFVIFIIEASFMKYFIVKLASSIFDLINTRRLLQSIFLGNALLGTFAVMARFL